MVKIQDVSILKLTDLQYTGLASIDLGRRQRMLYMTVVWY